MGHLNPPTVIVIDDSDQEDCPQPAVNSIAGPSNAPHPPTSQRGKSVPMPQLPPPTGAQTRQRSAKSKPHEIIEIDSDESSDKPPVSFY